MSERSPNTLHHLKVGGRNGGRVRVCLCLNESLTADDHTNANNANNDSSDDGVMDKSGLQ